MTVETTSADTRETFGFPVEVDISEEEYNTKNARNADVDREIRSLKNERAKMQADYKERLAALEKEGKTLLDCTTTRKMKVEVECYQERDERRGIMLTMRCDNGHIVDERALTAEERGAAADERQGNLFETTGTDVAAGAGDDEEEGPSDPDLESTLDEYEADQKAAAASAGDDDEEGALAH